MNEQQRIERGARLHGLSQDPAFREAMELVEAVAEVEFRHAQSPEQAWYACLLRRVIDDLGRILRAAIEDGRAQIGAQQREWERERAQRVTAESFSDYLHKAGEARSTWNAAHSVAAPTEAAGDVPSEAAGVDTVPPEAAS